eukprot:13917451-Ditylum_brightwellii.AAC.1
MLAQLLRREESLERVEIKQAEIEVEGSWAQDVGSAAELLRREESLERDEIERFKIEQFVLEQVEQSVWIP